MAAVQTKICILISADLNIYIRTSSEHIFGNKIKESTKMKNQLIQKETNKWLRKMRMLHALSWQNKYWSRKRISYWNCRIVVYKAIGFYIQWPYICLYPLIICLAYCVKLLFHAISGILIGNNISKKGTEFRFL